MNRFFTTIALSFMLISGAYAAPNNETDGKTQEKEQPVAVDTSKKAQSVMTENGADKKESSKSDAKKVSAKKAETGEPQSSKFPLISTIIAVLSLAFSVFVFFFSKSKYEELYDRFATCKDDIGSLKSELNNIKNSLESNNHKVNDKFTAIKEQILGEIKVSQNQKVEPVLPVVEPVEQSEPKFMSRTFYGIYKSKAKGVFVDQTTDIREGNSTLEIVTVSDNVATVHLVDNLTKTQFSNLNGDAVQVIEGNPQSYEVISEVEGGRMELIEDIWTLSQPIKVNLS